MSYCVFMHRPDSGYEDRPDEQYQFPRQYLSRARECIGDWIIYLEPTKVRGSRGYFAVAKVSDIIDDPKTPNMYLALIEPGTYLPFVTGVPFSGAVGVVEQGVLNDAGRISGRAQAAVRPISRRDFNSILALGLPDEDSDLPRVDEPQHLHLAEPQSLFDIPDVSRSRVTALTSRLFRDRVFRKVILTAYDSRCAVTGLRLINGGGRAEVEAAHIQPVEKNGPDIVQNGIALSGTAHWMFDRGLISIADDYKILVSTRINDPQSVNSILNPTRYLIRPKQQIDLPHPRYLMWHRENCFKV